MRSTAPSPTPRHAALVRGDDNALHVRRFATARGAALIAQGREYREPNTAGITMTVRRRAHAEMRHTEFAQELGISQRLVRAAFNRGELPGAKEHSAYILMVPAELLRLAKIYGLRQVGRLAKAGKIQSPTTSTP